eukprot:360950-Chlamydomonas_euryale.AAC.1
MSPLISVDSPKSSEPELARDTLREVAARLPALRLTGAAAPWAPCVPPRLDCDRRLSPPCPTEFARDAPLGARRGAVRAGAVSEPPAVECARDTL